GAPRFFTPTPIGADNAGAVIGLDESTAHHATRVLRLAAGDALTLFDGTGGEFDATLERVDRRGATVRVLRFVAVERESPLAITLAQAIAANDAMDSALRKATELGVTSIQPVVTARSSPLRAGERADKRLAHWRQVAIAACEQCGRNRVPDVAPPRPFADWLRDWTDSGVILVPAVRRSLAAIAQPGTKFALLVGPEGGFEAREVAAAQANGFASLALGPRVLRTETAATAGLAIVQAHWGDLR
ncbi:MAG TPA: 16S rRNA (uracil(1498)-N(3))-methyltransferase, partial [Casimicrobiaceae bacterium]|nr:16S rRNA (uracil(1498)-N(3))-methyltransferase [Casimicrobiaceae bacterium]